MKSTGTKIRKIAMVVEVVGIILTLFLAISIWVTGCESKSYRYSSSDENQAAITGFIILIAGISGSVCSGILIDGFGELVENSAITNHIGSEMAPNDPTVITLFNANVR